MKELRKFLKIEDLPGEIWKEIKGYPTYQISNYGRIKTENYCNWHKEGLLSEKVSKDGHHSVMLSNSNNKKEFGIGRLVAETFIPNPENKPFVYHKDGNGSNNKVDNLIWATKKEGERLIINSGRKTFTRYMRSVMAINSNKDCLNFKSITEAAKYFKVNRGTITNCIENKRKLNGYKFIFKNNESKIYGLNFYDFDGSNYLIEDIENEEWKVIDDFSNYQVSNYGRVKDILNNVIVHQIICKDGLFVDLYKDKKEIRCNVSNLVGKVFHNDDYCELLSINYKDSIVFNNHSDNLEYVIDNRTKKLIKLLGLKKKSKFIISTHLKAIFEDGKESFYSSIRDASECLDINTKFIIKHLNDDIYHHLKHCKFETIELTYEAYLKDRTIDVSLEKWKVIEGYPNYKISNKGRIMTFTRKSEHCGGFINFNNKRNVSLMNDNIEGHFSVSKLVANAFIPNLDNKEYVINIDGNFENNIVENLCWMTVKEHDNFLRLIGRKNSNGSKQAIIATKGKEILEFDSNKSASSYFNIGEDRLCRNIKSKTKMNGWLFQYKNHQKNYIREEKRKLDFSQYDGSNYQLEDLPGEVWKQIEEYPSYLVSNKGRLKNTNYRGRNEEAIVHQFIGKDYAVAYFYLENGRVSIRVSVEVAKAFKKDDIQPGFEVNHIDGYTLNNHIENLEWISHKDNVRHAVKTGLCDGAHFENSVHVKAIYKDGREEIYKSVEDASKELDIARNSIRNSLRDKEGLNKDTYHKIKHCRFEKIDISYEDYLRYKNN